jgi:hypothetical protein
LNFAFISRLFCVEILNTWLYDEAEVFRRIGQVISWPSTPPAVEGAPGSIGRVICGADSGTAEMMRPIRQVARMAGGGSA